MRRLLLLALFAGLIHIQLKSQVAGDPYKIWTDPVVYQFDQPVDWYFDMSGTSFPAGSDLYLWTWAPSEPDAGNWGNSSDFAKLTYVGDMVWKMTLTPTEYYHKTVEELTANADIFWMLVKDKTGSLKTNTIHVTRSTETINDFAASGKPVQIFPANFYLNQPLSILVNANEVYTNDGGTKGVVKGGLLGQPSIHLHSGLNSFADGYIVGLDMGVPALIEKTKFKDLGNGIYKLDMTPKTYYNVTDPDFVMENIQFVLPSYGWANFGTVQGGGDFVFLAPGVVAPPSPVLTIFPTKFSQKDLISITRLYNEKTVSKLVYLITAGGKTVTGEFTGTRDKYQAFIDLLTGLSGAGNLEKIHILVKDNNDRAVLDTDVNLVPLSNME